MSLKLDYLGLHSLLKLPNLLNSHNSPNSLNLFDSQLIQLYQDTELDSLNLLT